MKILSMNVNNFGGLAVKPTYGRESYREELQLWKLDQDEHLAHSEAITTYCADRKPDVICFQEFDVRSPAGQHLIDRLQALSYTMIYPNGTTKQTYLGGEWSIAVSFAQDNSWIAAPKCQGLHLTARWVEIERPPYRIVNVHVPFPNRDNGNFWDTMNQHYQAHAQDKLMFIGDMNVYDPGTRQKEKLDQLLSLGAIDAWIAKNNPADTPTFNTGKRIDYALMTPLLAQDLVQIQIDDTPRIQRFTDHSALIVTW